MKTKLLIATLAITSAIQTQADTIVLTSPTITTTNNDTVKIGNSSSTDFSIIVGQNAGITNSSTGPNGGVAIGNGATVNVSGTNQGSYNTVALGNAAHVDAQGGLSIGANTYTGFDGIAIGTLSEAHTNRSTAIGAYATVLGDANSNGESAIGSTALGYLSSVSAKDQVNGDLAAFTNKAVSDEKGVVSVGRSADASDQFKLGNVTFNTGVYTDYYKEDAFDRRIINVEDGVKENDAVNVRQVSTVQNGLQTQINGLNTTTNSIVTRVDNLQTQVKDLNASTSTVITQMNNLQTQVSGLDTATSNIGTRVDNLQTQVNDLNTSTSTVITQVTNLQTQVSDLNTTTSNVGTRVDGLQNQINSLNTSSSNTNARMDNLENRVAFLNDRLEDSTALSLATAGLVSPPEGKSGLVVGTGFFRSGKALAVGYAHTASSWGFKASISAAGSGNFGGAVSGGFFW